MRKNDHPEVEPVVLKNLGSIRPGVYILAGLIAALLLAFFAVFFLHGLVTDKSYIRFTTDLKGFAIYEDGHYLGSTDGSVYRTTSGEHKYTVSYNGIAVSEITYDVERYYFATLFRRPVQEIEFTPQSSESLKSEIENTFASEIAAWSRVTDYSDRYHFPPLYSDLASNAKALSLGDISSVWLYGAMHITSDTLYQDYLKGRAILEDSNVIYSSDMLASLEKNLSSIIDGSGKSVKMDSERTSVKPVRDGEFFYYGKSEVIMGTDSSLSYPECNTYPVKTEAGPFAISAVAVSEYEYALFVEENPEWAKSNKAALMEKGLVDDNYLNGITLNTKIVSGKPIRNISYYAAEAYTAWYSQKTGVNAVLPTEAEWTVAALSASYKSPMMSLISMDTDLNAPQNMMGQLWEFTSSSYIPLGRVSGYAEAEELSAIYPYDDIVIKGGSYISDFSKVSLDSVGVMTRSACSEYTGFRIAIR